MIWCPVLWLLCWSALLHKWSVWRRISEPVVKFGLWGRQADRSAQCRAFAGSLGFFCLGIVYWCDSMIAAATYTSELCSPPVSGISCNRNITEVHPSRPFDPLGKIFTTHIPAYHQKAKKTDGGCLYNLWHDWLVASRIACVIYKYPDLHALWIRRLVSSDH